MENNSRAKDSLYNMIALSKEKTRQSRQTAKAKNNIAAYYKTWQDSFYETYPKSICLCWSVKDMGMIKQLIKAGIPETDIKPFLAYAVCNWKRVIDFYIIKSKNAETIPPALPDIKYLLFHRSAFLQAYSAASNGTKEVSRPLPTPAAPIAAPNVAEIALQRRLQDAEAQLTDYKRRYFDLRARVKA